MKSVITIIKFYDRGLTIINIQEVELATQELSLPGAPRGGLYRAPKDIMKKCKRLLNIFFLYNKIWNNIIPRNLLMQAIIVYNFFFFINYS